MAALKVRHIIWSGIFCLAQFSSAHFVPDTWTFRQTKILDLDIVKNPYFTHLFSLVLLSYMVIVYSVKIKMSIMISSCIAS